MRKCAACKSCSAFFLEEYFQGNTMIKVQKKIFKIFFAAAFLSVFTIFFSCASSSKLSGLALKNAITIQAEDGGLYGVDEESEIKGFNGTSYVKFSSVNEGSVLEFYADVEKEGDYCIFLRIFTEIQEEDFRRPIRMQLEQGEKIIASQRLMESGKFVNIQVNAVSHLQSGSNVFYLSSLGGEFLVDEISFVQSDENYISSITPSNKLSNPKASKNAQALFNYLVTLPGNGILSGQQIYNRSQPEIKAIYQTTGKYPALLGIDLIDYSPSRVQHGTKGVVAANAIKWWKEGGIVSVCWHWNAPNGLVDKNEPYKHWYDGFRPSATTFDFATALNNPDSQNYKDLIRDIDAIAVPLKQMADAGVPVLWRPLHEASGGWFWWGASGSDSYIKLYHLLYDRLTNYHKLNNLIWVWNGQDPEWYPGDEYVDMITYDSYPGPHKHITQETILSQLRSASYCPKLMAISENGSLPDVNAIAENKIPWIAFCTWDGEFAVNKKNDYSESYTSKEVLLDYYSNPYLITRDELPDLNVEKN